MHMRCGIKLDVATGRLACPACHGTLALDETSAVCPECDRYYSVEEGIPRFAPAESWRPRDAEETSFPYREKFMEAEAARSYRRLYEGSFSKRLTTWREKRMLSRLLATQGRCQSMLDLPCGNGRVSSIFAAVSDLLIEADIGIGQVMLGRQMADWTTPTVWMTASAFEIPLRDNAVDGAVCVRLMHHLPSAAEQERLVAELLRVSRRFVLLTFFDSRSLKQLLSRVCGRRKHRHHLSLDAIARLAEAHGGRLAASPRLFPIGTGQRYALLVKNPGRRGLAVEAARDERP